MSSELQVENGHFTRIVNPLIEELVKVPFRGCELAVALFVIRKTYGFNKKKDAISLSQLCVGVARTRPTVVVAVKNLELSNILVKTAKPYATNTYEINKYFDTWRVGKTAKLVKRKHGGSKYGSLKVVKTAKHTKDNTKDNTKDIASQSDAGLIAQVIALFEPVNPSFKRWYGNTTQRGATDRLLVEHGYDRVEKVIALLPRTNVRAYFPTITTPLQLETDWAKLRSKLEQEKDKSISNGRGLA